MSDMHNPRQDAATQCALLKQWLLEQAYPLWFAQGYDRQRGGFHEKLDQQGEALDLPRRARVQPRQIYSFAVAPSLGWTGAATEVTRRGLELYLTRYRRPDGLFRSLVAPDGTALDETIAFYDQAFALFGLATAAGALCDMERLEALALETLEALKAQLSHPVAGFIEPAGAHRQQSNPHMHLLEACLAWEELGGAAIWRDMADTLASLALTRFIDADTGALREFFAADWRPAAGTDGRIVEPGHQYEWAWLLLRWGGKRQHAGAIAAALRLIDIAENHGVDGVRKVAINALLDDFTAHDAGARLWPQTERIKAGALAGEVTGDQRYWTVAAEGARGLLAYFQTPRPGLWWDRMQPDGGFVDEPAPASSFYHIVCAIAEFDRAVTARA